MPNPINSFWINRLADVQAALIKNNFSATVVKDTAGAHEFVLSEILPQVNPSSISWGGSLTFIESRLYDTLKERKDIKVLDTFDTSIKPDAMLERRRETLLVDLYITGTNAVTQGGQLVNLDMIGNRVAALTFGPKHVIILVGRNKIVPDMEAARQRIKNYAAPVNVKRLDKKTPCNKTAYCNDCSSPERICNTWTITEKSFPKGRVHVILINQDLGF